LHEFDTLISLKESYVKLRRKNQSRKGDTVVSCLIKAAYRLVLHSSLEMLK